MSDFVTPVNAIKSLKCGREAWKIRARVGRIWERCPLSDPTKPYAIHMILIDSEV